MNLSTLSLLAHFLIWEIQNTQSEWNSSDGKSGSMAMIPTLLPAGDLGLGDPVGAQDWPCRDVRALLPAGGISVLWIRSSFWDGEMLDPLKPTSYSCVFQLG